MKSFGGRCAALVSISWAAMAAEGLRIYPEKVSLAGLGATQRYVVIATGADGVDRDVTAEAAITTSNGKSVEIDAVHKAIRGANEGAAHVEARYQGRQAAAQRGQIRLKHWA